MFRHRSNIVLGIIFLLLMAGSFIYYNLTTQTKYKWGEEYKIDREEPFDLKFTHRLLMQVSPEKKFLYTGRNLQKFLLALDTTKPSNMLFIGNEYQVDKNNAQWIANYISQGNTFMLASSQFPAALREAMFQRMPSTSFQDAGYEEPAQELSPSQPYGTLQENQQGTFLSFPTMLNDSILIQSASGVSDDFRKIYFRHYDLDRYSEYFWNGIDTGGLFEMVSAKNQLPLKLEVLESVNQRYPGMLRIRYGKGWLIVHPNPLLFTNYFVAERPGFEYIAHAFSYFNRGPVIWELYGMRSEHQGDFSEGAPISKSPMKFILSQPPLRLAWYVLLVMLLLFIIFRSKRTQRAIPVLEEKTNDSQEFYSTISRLYYLNRNNLYLGKLMFRHFQLVCRRRFLIHIHENPASAKHILSKKSGLQPEHIQELFDALGRLEMNLPLTDAELIAIYIKLRHFYNQINYQKPT